MILTLPMPTAQETQLLEHPPQHDAPLPIVACSAIPRPLGSAARPRQRSPLSGSGPLAVDLVDSFLLGLPIGTGDPLLGVLSLGRSSRGRVSERQDRDRRASLQRQEPPETVDVFHRVRARAHAVVPRSEHHVLSNPSTIERSRLLLQHDRDGQPSRLKVRRARDNGCQVVKRRTADHDERPRLGVLRAAADTSCVNDSINNLGGDLQGCEIADFATTDNSKKRIHKRKGRRHRIHGNGSATSLPNPVPAGSRGPIGLTQRTAMFFRGGREVVCIDQ